MSFINALNANTVRTENGADAYESSNSPTLDLFYLAAASRGKDITSELEKALLSDETTTGRILLWLRDVRGGAGERQQFRDCLTHLTKHNIELAGKLMKKIPEVGRFDDLTAFWGTPLETQAANLWVNAIRAGNGLAAKWAPRKDKKGAKPLRQLARLNERDWRKLVVSLSDTLEQKMCADKWNEVDPSKLPSLALARNVKALWAHAQEIMEDFSAKVKSGDATVNAGAIYPHDVVKAVFHSPDVVDAQWNSLPNYFEGSKYTRVLPVVDVSASMNTEVSKGTRAIDVAIALGIYCSHYNTGPFHNCFITFSQSPSLNRLVGDSLYSKVRQLKREDWGYNTDLGKVFNLILSTAVSEDVPADEMPEVVLIPSDMQFDTGCSGRDISRMKPLFEAAGYEMPKVVYWNLNSRSGCIPVTVDSTGNCLVSGFSPAILKAVLSGDIDPESIMLRALEDSRYDF